MSNSQTPPQQGTVANRSVTRAIRILRALSSSETAMTVSDVAKKIDLPRATTFRLLMTLEEEGIVDRQDTLYSLGWDLARIAQTVDPASGLVPRINDVVEAFADEVGETVTFSLRRGLYELDVVIQANPRLLGMTMSDMHGMRWPPYASATGKLLLADLSPEQVRLALGDTLTPLTEHTITNYQELDLELERVRQQGWAGTLQELEDGVISYAAPIRNSLGALLGAIAIIFPLHRMGPDDEHAELIDRLIAVAHRVRHRLDTSNGD